MDPVKVVFDGAPGTGKSKTLETVRQFFAMNNNLRQMFGLPTLTVGFVNEAAWDLFEQHPDIDRGALATQRTILGMMQQRETEVRHCDVVFIDRGAYSIKVYERTFGMEDMSPLYDEIEVLSRSYDLVYIFHPDNVILKNNAVRIEDAELREELHRAFCRNLEEFGTEFQLLLAENTERAGRVIGDVLNALTEKRLRALPPEAERRASYRKAREDGFLLTGSKW
ncbi:MAG: ATP-binding protein [Candidatus Sericytochromatia bacterium]|nr:ATP-binding protein [Candidatus Tanganyikabacteria bacterium]